MKKLIPFLFIFGLLLSCDPKPEIEDDKGQLDPNYNRKNKKYTNIKQIVQKNTEI